MCVRPLTITYGNGSERGLTAEVKFFYRDMADANVRTFRIGSQQGMRNKLLSSVSTSINNQVHRKYDFTYDETASDKFSRLVRITESNSNGESLNPTVLTWNTDFKEEININDVDITFRYDFEAKENVCFFSADINGDGISDFARTSLGRDVRGGESQALRYYLSHKNEEGEVLYLDPNMVQFFPSSIGTRYLGGIKALDFD